VARVERLKDEVRRLDQIEKDMDKHRQVRNKILLKLIPLQLYYQINQW